MLDSDVKTQQQQKTNKKKKKNQLSKHNKAKSSHSPGPTAFKSSEIASLNIGCLGPRFGPDFGVVPVHGYHFGAIVNSLEI